VAGQPITSTPVPSMVTGLTVATATPTVAFNVYNGAA
jgi:hypothetical protein